MIELIPKFKKIVPLKRKLGESAEKPRILEEEGYYVGTKPYITIKNRNLMEDRLLRLSDNVNKSAKSF